MWNCCSDTKHYFQCKGKRFEKKLFCGKMGVDLMDKARNIWGFSCQGILDNWTLTQPLSHCNLFYFILNTFLLLFSGQFFALIFLPLFFLFLQYLHGKYNGCASANLVKIAQKKHPKKHQLLTTFTKKHPTFDNFRQKTLTFENFRCFRVKCPKIQQT